MGIYQQCDVTYRLNGKAFQGAMHVEETTTGDTSHYQAFIDSSALRGTYGGVASDVPQALDFLNLAMQAEGADEIVFTCRQSEAA